jgi:hypothetical protein
MAQQKRQVSALQEYPGAYVWRDYEKLCPECGEWTMGSDTETQVGDEWHVLCESCAAKVEIA